MTVLELVQAMSSLLDEAGVSYGHGTTNAFDEAAWLVLWRLGWPLDALDAAAGQAVGDAQQQTVRALVQQRISTRRPAAYLTGEAWLQGVPFYVDERVIVPRSLIAEPLVEGALDAWLPPGPLQVLDLCTGSGSLAVLAALAWPDAQVRATDLSAPALDVARRNVERHGLQARVTLAQGDGLDAAPGCHDLILCNPPYVDSAAMARLPAEYRAEPRMALDGGHDGMDFVRRLLERAAAHMSPGAVLVLEIGHGREHFESAFARLPALWLSTSAGDDQVVLLERAALA